MADIYANNHFHNTTNCTFVGCTVVTQSLPSAEEAEAANNTLIRELAGVSPEVAARFSFSS